MRCHFIPGYLLDRIARSDDPALAEWVRRTTAIDQQIRERRSVMPGQVAPSGAAKRAWEIHDAGNGSTLPGRLVRTPDRPAGSDVTVEEAAVGITESLALFTDLGRASYDGKGAEVVATVHYEKDYDNAFWDGTQLVFGDGDGKVFGRFTKPIDVLGHELTHAVTQYSANLTYQGQSGALNESMSDVFGACIKQRHLGQTAADADWLVGEGIFLPGIHGKALRSMTDPGTAYDDPQLGKDPQVGNMADYVTTTDDNGGVHLNSGIPNRAFALAARAVGGESWSGAGRIWYAALTSGLPADADFATFAAATVAAAGDHAAAVQDAWSTVGVGTGAAPSGAGTGGASAPGSASHRVEVGRSGGLTGVGTRSSVDLDSDDPRASEARDLLHRIDFAAVDPGEPQPDRFVYRFRYAARHELADLQVHEEALTAELRRLADLVLGD